MSAKNKKSYAFYSKTQENINRRGTMHCDDGKLNRKVKHNIYENLNGEEVVVTEVTSDPNYVSRFKDAVSLGEVKQWVRVVFW
ncbi:hypothetical protein N8751_01200 [bacterium]|nr:hypothetical protein [bacterium]